MSLPNPVPPPPPKPKRKRVKAEPQTYSILVPGTHYRSFDEPPFHQSGEIFASAGWQELRRHGLFFTRAGQVVMIDKKTCKLKFLTDRSLRSLIERYLTLEAWPKPVANASPEVERRVCSLDWASLMLEHPTQVDSESGDIWIPELLAIAPHPLLDLEGNVLIGKHKTPRGVVWTPKIVLPEPIAPFDLLEDFPMDRASLAHAMAVPLTMMWRPLLDGNVPFFGVTASVERSGKTKLSEDFFGGTMLGAPTPTIQWPKDEDEVDKRILSIAIAGHSLINMDNIPSILDSPSLTSFVTASAPGGRMLGKNEYVSVPNTITLVGTGNHMQFSAELAKRACMVRLNPGVENPELRTGFRYPDFRGAIMGRRWNTIAWYVAMVQKWVAMGRPPCTRPFGGFERWGGTVGGVVEHAMELPILQDRASNVIDMDNDGQDLKHLIECWFSVHGSSWVTTAELMPCVTNENVRAWESVMSTSKAPLISLGRILGRYVDRIADGYRIERSGSGSRRLYRLVGMSR